MCVRSGQSGKAFFPLMVASYSWLLQVAKRRLIQANLGLVLKAVSSYNHQKQVDIEDLVQAGLYGLSRGIDKYDPDRGNRVSTVAYMWTREAVGRAYNESARTIKISERALTSVRS